MAISPSLTLIDCLFDVIILMCLSSGERSAFPRIFPQNTRLRRGAGAVPQIHFLIQKVGEGARWIQMQVPGTNLARHSALSAQKD